MGGTKVVATWNLGNQTEIPIHSAAAGMSGRNSRTGIKDESLLHDIEKEVL